MEKLPKEALSVLAYLYLEHFKYDKALRLLRILKKYYPEDAEIRRSLSYAYLKTGDFQEALHEAEACFRGKLKPADRLAASLIKAKALWGLGKEEAARHTFTQVVHAIKLPKPKPQTMEEEEEG